LMQLAPMAFSCIKQAGPGKLSAKLTMRTPRSGLVEVGLNMSAVYKRWV
jgi:hypothetical protein